MCRRGRHDPVIQAAHVHIHRRQGGVPSPQRDYLKAGELVLPLYRSVVIHVCVVYLLVISPMTIRASPMTIRASLMTFKASPMTIRASPMPFQPVFLHCRCRVHVHQFSGAVQLDSSAVRESWHHAPREGPKAPVAGTSHPLSRLRGFLGKEIQLRETLRP